MSNHNFFEIFRDTFANKILQTENTGQLFDLIRKTEEFIPKLPDDSRLGFSFSYADYQDAVEDCRKLKKTLKYTDRVEMMVGVRELPYPYTCVVETKASNIRFLDEELVSKHQELRLKDDETGIRNIAQLIAERQSLLRRETWETDPPLMGFTSWE